MLETILKELFLEEDEPGLVLDALEDLLALELVVLHWSISMSNDNNHEEII